MDVGQLFFRDLHFHRDVSDVGNAAQLVAGIQVLIQLAFDERGGDDAVDRGDDIRLAEFLVEDCDLLLQLGDVALRLADLLGPASRLQELQLALGFLQFARLEIGFPVRGFR